MRSTALQLYSISIHAPLAHTTAVAGVLFLFITEVPVKTLYRETKGQNTIILVGCFATVEALMRVIAALG